MQNVIRQRGGGVRDKGVEWKYNQRHTKKEKKFELISQQN